MLMDRLNVYEAVQKRLKIIFDYFDYVYISFSGGKDSGVLLNLCMDYIRKHAPERRLGVFHMDYEAQYRQTTEYVERTFAANSDILEVFHCCIPFKVSTCTSMFQQYWRPWDDGCKDIWVRKMPDKCLTYKDFDFFNADLWDYDFQNMFTEWLHHRKKSKRICCLVGIRTQESFNRWRVIHSDKNYRKLNNYKWTRRTGHHEYNAYPIYDWKTTDIWTANGRFNWDYNRFSFAYAPDPENALAASLQNEGFGGMQFINLATATYLAAADNGTNLIGRFGITTGEIASYVCDYQIGQGSMLQTTLRLDASDLNLGGALLTHESLSAHGENALGAYLLDQMIRYQLEK